MIICAVRSRDLAAIARLEEDGIPSPWSLGQLEAELAGPGGIMQAAHCDDRLCGYVALRVIAPEAELLRLLVAPAYRRQGIAGRLITVAQQELINSGVETCFLEVRRSNTAARALYTGYGFTLCGCRADYFRGPKEDALVLQKDLMTRLEKK